MSLLEEVDAQPEREVVLPQLVDLLLVLTQVQETAAGHAGHGAALRHGVARCWNGGWQMLASEASSTSKWPHLTSYVICDENSIYHT